MKRPPKPADTDAPRGLRRSMAWIHTWLGLLAGWILFAMFLTGTASYFRPEITRWMQPEIRPAPVAPAHAAQAAMTYLDGTAHGAEQWYIYLPDERTDATRVFVREKPEPTGMKRARPQRSELKLDPATGQPLAARDTLGGEHFYRFHFQLQLPHPWGRWLAGLCAIFMLAAIISGVITHKRIFADFFTLRWGKGQRSWLDAHNVSAVLALPFHAMITYTGLITLVAMYMPWPIMANYASPQAFQTEAFGREPDEEASGRPARLAAIAPMIAQAQREWHGGEPRTIVVRNPNDSTATVTILRTDDDQLNGRSGTLTFSGTTGRRLAGSPSPGPALTTAGVMLGLHMGHFAGPLLRWCYFALGLIGAAMVGTGLLLWTAKRRKAAPFAGFGLVERLNIAAIACLPAGMAALLLANRLIPATMDGRAEMEVAAMFWTWFGLAALSLLRPVRRAWAETLAFSALAFGALPFVNAMTTDRSFLHSIASGDWLFAAFDAAMLALAGMFACAAAKAHRLLNREGPARRRQRAESTEMERAADAA